jgi:hypothetical protein
MQDKFPALFAVLTGLLLPQGASAQGPAAIVERVQSKTAGVEFMDYVSPGKVIRLEPGDTLVLGYLASCWRESIVAGTVTIGAQQSTVAQGKVTRTKVSCDGGQMQLTPAEANKSGALSFRAPHKDRKNGHPDPAVTIYGRSPMFELGRPGTLKIERLDTKSAAIEVTANKLVQGTFFDLAGTSHALDAGGLYRVTHSGQQVLFKVDPTAQTGQAPVVGRLVRFPPHG